MKQYFLNYYPKFRCVADKCKHTCCAGWEMNIDKDTLDIYGKENSGFSSRLKLGVDFENSRFRTDEKGRCAFLNDLGLCEIIMNLGEGRLCQVCRDHPRFRSFFVDRTETGLGLSCEEVARIVLSFEDKIQPLLASDDGKSEQPDFIQKAVFDFRQKVISLVQDRNMPVNDRINGLLKLCYADFCEQNLTKALKTFASLETLSDSWKKRLKSIKKPFDSTTDEKYSQYFEQFLVNGFYRHLLDAEDTTWVRARALGCLYSWWLIKSIIQEEEKGGRVTFDLVVDVVREYSTEVEYSQENLDKLFNVCYKFIKL